MTKRPAFWMLLVVASLASVYVGVRYFPQAFSIVSLDIEMDREQALARAREIADRDGLGPSGFRQAASFSLDSETQTFVELEGGGKEAFTRMMREGRYSAYTWRVRHFREAEANETTIRFTPEGRPYGFVERLSEDAPGAALEAAAARAIAERAAPGWNVDLAAYVPIEQGQERRPGGRVDHTFTYERPTPTLNEGRYRLRLVVSGDRVTEVTPFVWIPEAFSRRYANMRSANDAIGMGGAVGMILLYVFGGIGVGLFFMLRQRWVIWRQAAAWGIFVALLQALTAINQLPLQWMTYDTAQSRLAFLGLQAVTIVASFVGFSAFFALSFMAAESLTRRAFGSHPQFWKLWSPGPGSSTAVLGRTAAGFLLVSIFFAYEVGLYLIATRGFGWWTPAEALLHPDVLATYVPWLSAIANSLQAGFWEECLFRAVPIAGAALIGDRLGQRRLFIVMAFVVQAIIFGAGHAPYPTQPSYARPVELIIPSIGFGLLYLYYGLLPAIVLHFAFDVVWFALPIFVSSASGIWIQQSMVVVMTFVPLWVVLWRRWQAGRWTTLSVEDLNASWTPAPAEERAAPVAVVPRYTVGPRARLAWMLAGGIGIAIAGAAALSRAEPGALTIGRAEAAAIARSALEARGVELPARWRVLPVPTDGSGGAHEFVADTSGDERRRQLLGSYLPQPHWRVHVRTFEGDVAERAEAWEVSVRATGEVGYIGHTLPEGRAGAALDEEAARRLAHEALADRPGLDAAKGEVREVSAVPSKLAARTDWTFIYTDLTVPALSQGEPRIRVRIAGDEVASVGRFLHVPEEWERRQRAASTRSLIVAIATGLVFGGLLVSAAVGSVVAWSRRRYTPRLFVAGALTMFAVSALSFVNGWPSVLAQLQTALPFRLQILGIVGVGFIALTLTSVLVGLALGGLPHRLTISGRLPDREAAQLGVALGLVGVALAAAAAWLRTPAWASFPDIAPVGTLMPIVEVALDPVTGFLTRTAILVVLLAVIHEITAGWTRRRLPGALALVIVGFLGSGPPVGMEIGGWIAAGMLTGAGLLAAYVGLVRADLTVAPLALGTMGAVGALARGAGRPFPAALAGSIVAAVIVAGLAWWWFRALRQWTARVAGPPPSETVAV